MNSRPSHWVLRFLEWFCPPGLHEGIEGDLLEQLELDCDRVGERRARRLLVWNVLKFFRLSILLRNRYSLQLTNAIVINNYIKVASRNILKRKMYSFINAFGLSIGIAFSILIYLYIKDEQSFDKFHVNKERIYRLESRSFNTDEASPESRFETFAWLQLGLRPELLTDIPEVEFATRFSSYQTAITRYGDKVFTEGVAMVDNHFFNIFSFDLLKGSKKDLFTKKSEVVITPAIAEKYFGSDDPLGKSIMLDIGEERSYTVTGIIEAPPANSSLEFSILVPIENRMRYDEIVTRWTSWNTPTFVQLHANADLKSFKANLDKLVDKHLGKQLEKWRSESVVPVPPDVRISEYVFTPISEVHLKKEVSWSKVSDPKYSFILGGIALLILVIASINYVSLALTTSASRRTEVGIRKAVGAQRNQLVYQFGFESILLAMISMVIGVVLMIIFLPYFNSFTGKGIAITFGGMLELLVYCCGITLIVGLFAGSYPALFLSRFRPAVVLKGQFTSRLTAGFTKPLVVLQFALSAFLIISAVIMYRQMQFIAQKDLGFDKDNIIVIPAQKGWTAESEKIVQRFRTRLGTESSVISIAATTFSFNKGYNKYGFKVNDEHKSAHVYGVDADYLTTLGIDIIQGRNFDPRIPADSNAVVVNESLVRDLRWKDPLNEYLNWREDTVGLGSKVIGVVRDYHFLSLEGEIEPMLLSMDKHYAGHPNVMLIKLAAGSLPESIDMLRKAWNDVSPSLPFEYSFLDEDVAAQYASYDRWMKIMGFSTGFAILISSLGLFGLSGINAVNRTKEIGIRKVMGAELLNIFILLNKQYMWLAVIAFVVAAPASWYVMSQWFSDFEFSITIGWELFAISMAGGLIIALLTVSYHAVRTALINPAETLKYE